VEGRLAAAGIAVAATLALPVAAQAAALSVTPAKPCYRSGETIEMLGSGFTPGGQVTITSDGRPIEDGVTRADGAGNIKGDLTVVSRTERIKTYGAIDQSNSSNSASIPLRISPLSVSLSPLPSHPGRPLRIVARGFTTGARLYAHVVRRGRSTDFRIGLLRGACRKLSVRRRLFPGGAAPGAYVVQFDTRRRYSRATPVKQRIPIRIT
jgi:hypothetical protein